MNASNHNLYLEIFYNKEWNNANPLSYKNFTNPLFVMTDNYKTVIYSATQKCLTPGPTYKKDFIPHISGVVYRETTQADDRIKPKEEIVNLNLSMSVWKTLSPPGDDDTVYFTELKICTLEDWRQYLNSGVPADEDKNLAKQAFDILIERAEKFRVDNGIDELDESNIRVIIISNQKGLHGPLRVVRNTLINPT